MSPCIRIPNGIVCVAGPIYKGRDKKTGKIWYWEFHRYCGPAVTTKDGEIIERYQPAPGKYSRFWPVFYEWFDKSKFCKKSWDWVVK